jgi:hypothetical protein
VPHGANRNVSDFSATAAPPDEQQPVPLEWRPALERAANAFAAGNYMLQGLAGVEPAAAATAAQVREYLADYGATLVSLPEETWDSSVCIWSGHHWDVLVDLWTQEEGRSDLVMHAHVGPSGVVSVHAVYVP